MCQRLLQYPENFHILRAVVIGTRFRHSGGVRICVLGSSSAEKHTARKYSENVGVLWRIRRPNLSSLNHSVEMQKSRNAGELIPRPHSHEATSLHCPTTRLLAAPSRSNDHMDVDAILDVTAAIISYSIPQICRKPAHQQELPHLFRSGSLEDY